MKSALIENVLIGGNHLANILLNNNIFPDQINTVEEIESLDLRDVWIAWRAIMNLSEAKEQNNPPVTPDRRPG